MTNLGDVGPRELTPSEVAKFVELVTSPDVLTEEVMEIPLENLRMYGEWCLDCDCDGCGDCKVAQPSSFKVAT